RTTVNEKRFRPLLSPYSSSTIDPWAHALLRVKIDTSRLSNHPGAALFKGFAFPDSHIFLDDNNDKAVGLVIAWLTIRASWMATLNEVNPRDLPLPNPQQWRSFLHDISLDLELVQPDTRNKMPKELPPDHKPARSSRRNAKSKAVAEKIFNVSIPGKQALHFVKWNNHTVWTRDRIDLAPLDRRLVIWDIQEHNFRLELFTLDKCLLSESWAMTEGASLRERKLHTVFCQETILMMDLPENTANLASPHWKDRRVFVEAFHSVLLDWPGAIGLNLASEKSVDNENLWLEVERVAFRFYCQSFFDHFGRAPSVPHSFPAT
ncbi:hypothetical protein AGABI2DRAFT_60941, partial [Agaricus bisporus var. bisporus H97]|uniref:hypothetical protein n=1 Tax=Agaricus bisporus var. bisporus (strain H97 / ATCC MYA-4626 / FGSC 10389) TaxID=936046 RepID=UPI00029F623E